MDQKNLGPEAGAKGRRQRKEPGIKKMFYISNATYLQLKEYQHRKLLEGVKMTESDICDNVLSEGFANLLK